MLHQEVSSLACVLRLTLVCQSCMRPSWLDTSMPMVQVFAPLARLLGLYSIKEELEALSFMYSDPEGYAAVQRRLDVLAKTQGDVVLAVSSFCLCMAYGIYRHAQDV